MKVWLRSPRVEDLCVQNITATYFSERVPYIISEIRYDTNIVGHMVPFAGVGWTVGYSWGHANVCPLTRWSQLIISWCEVWCLFSWCCEGNKLSCFKKAFANSMGMILKSVNLFFFGPVSSAFVCVWEPQRLHLKLFRQLRAYLSIIHKERGFPRSSLTHLTDLILSYQSRIIYFSGGVSPDGL